MRRRDVRSSNEPTKATLSLSGQMPLILVFVRAAVQGRDVDVQQRDGADARRDGGGEHAERRVRETAAVLCGMNACRISLKKNIVLP